ncbi:cytochrome c oxidase subunit 3 [Pseudomonas lalucatii]|uniref:Cytochrome c oxidase subunit 3 n=1 Tax=Pseudomonas lalucatii TaxID=1424203 RepID=A0ABS5PXZ0_9PSED|nr:cytochrome c oxidase subunit 3 [Pseudomonas lalucatii]MBS7661370.1 cytochrome c oxidase subunit 3 [Pseudomonas lalucatii]QVM87869.1 cytochrome c oxidase subunit 3 [Pseudomonas lalucatii]
MNRLLLRDAGGADPGGNWGPQSDGPLLAGGQRARTVRFGLRLFLVVVSSLFLLFLIAFITRSQVADWQPLTEPLAPLAQPRQLWLNTASLVAASIALQWARVAARQGRATSTALAFALGGAFAIAFLLGQLWLWRQFVVWGYGVAGNPANSFFFLLTGLHGLHLLGGLVAWGRTLGRLLRGAPLARLGHGVELCAIYWHYLLGLWLLLFAVLTSTPETYRAIAAFCGLR